MFGKTTVTLSDPALKVIRQWGGSVFHGFGAYSVQEVALYAGKCYLRDPVITKLNLNNLGLSPFLTAYEVFTNPSCLARLLLAMRQFSNFNVHKLWYA